MEVRCSSCNKLFRVADEKIVGSGIKFGCSRCSSTVKITREDFELYLQSKRAAAAVAPAPAGVSAIPSPRPAAPKPPVKPVKAPQEDVFDLSEPAAAAAAMQDRVEEMPAFAQPAPPKPMAAPHAAAPGTGPKVIPRPAAAIQPKIAPSPQPRPAPTAPAKPKQEQARPVSPAAPPAPGREAHRPVPRVVEAPPVQPARSSGFGKKVVVLIVALIVIGSLGAGAKYYFTWSSQRVSDTVKQLTLPDGLQVRNASGTVDPVKQDLVVSGFVENATDNPKLAWYILVEVYDAQGAVLTRAKLLNGKQLFTRRDFEIMAKRGENIQEIKTKQLQEPGVIIPAHGSVNFEVRVLEPPVGIATFNPLLQPFDPVQLFKEMAEEQK